MLENLELLDLNKALTDSFVNIGSLTGSNISNLPEHAFNNTNSNASQSGNYIEVELISQIKQALNGHENGGYWLSDVDGVSVLLSDAEIGYDLNKFSHFINQHKQSGAEKFVYVIKTSDDVKLLSFGVDDLDSASIASDFESGRLNSVSSVDSDDSSMLSSLKLGSLFSLKSEDGVSLLTTLGDYKVADIGSNLIAAARYIAMAATGDTDSIDGRLGVASSSISAIGASADVATAVLSAVGVANKGVIALSSAGGVLTGVSNIINMGLLASKFNELSQSEQIAAGVDLGLKAAGSIAIAGSAITSAVLSAYQISSTLPGLGAAAAAVSLAISPMAISELVSDGNRVNALEKLGAKMNEAGYIGDTLLAGLLREKLGVDAGYVSASLIAGVVTSAMQAASVVSLVGAPAAAIAGVVSGVVLGIMEASKQASLEAIANKYKAQIEELGGGKVLSESALSTIHNIDISSKLNQINDLQKAYGTDYVIDVSGVSLSKSVLELAAITKITNDIKTATNFAALVKDGKIQTPEENKFLLDNDNGTLQVQSTSSEDSLISFSAPLFAPGKQEQIRSQVGKNDYYTKLVLSVKDGYSINGGAGNDTFLPSDNYASLVVAVDGKTHNLKLKIDGNDGNDRLIGDGGSAVFDGGNGHDSAIYSSEHIGRVLVAPNESGDGYFVTKNITDALVATERVQKHFTQYGKRTETTEYRDMEISHSSYLSRDELKNVESIVGSSGNDIMYGSAGNDIFIGLDGNDKLVGNNGDDLLVGGNGDDIIHGGSGNDILIGGSGTNNLVGGSGNDLYIIDSTGKNSIIDYFGKNSIIINDLSNDFTVKNIDGKIRIDFNDTGNFAEASYGTDVYAMISSSKFKKVNEAGLYKHSSDSLDFTNFDDKIALIGATNNETTEIV